MDRKLFVKKWSPGFRAAISGYGEGLRTQTNVRIHLLFTLTVVSAGWYFSIRPHEWMAILGCIGLVTAMELMNTAIEYLMDFIHPDRHAQVGKIKDLSAAAVLVAALTAVGIGLLIFPKYFLSLWHA